jgi:hypothetical protein
MTVDSLPPAMVAENIVAIVKPHIVPVTVALSRWIWSILTFVVRDHREADASNDKRCVSYS